MKSKFLFLSLFSLLFFTTNCHGQDITVSNTEILWDSWGVPHIFATNDIELFYSHAWVQMESHGDLILKLYGQARGRAAEYWGEGYLDSDVLIHTMGVPELAAEWYEKQDDRFKGYLNAFAKGINDYADKHSKLIGEEAKLVLPVTVNDVLAHVIRVTYLRFVGGRDLGMAQRWGSLGSNAYAIAPSRSASGNAMLVCNPHLPWGDFFLFYEAQLSAPGYSLYGVSLVGMPGLSIGFSNHHGWTHTVNTIDAADTYVLKLKNDGYLLDGKLQSFDKSSKVLKIKQADGSFAKKEIEIRSSVHGPVISMKETEAVAIHIAGLDKAGMIKQWWDMGRAKNLAEFETALKQMQLPMFNVVYSDNAGNIYYFFGGNVPVRTEGGWGFWQGMVPGDLSKYLWTDTHSYEEMPKVVNPESGWLQNANDPPWSCTFPIALNPDDFPAYMSPKHMAFRPQRAVRMLAEDESITYDELVSYKLSTRMELADRILDDLFEAGKNSESQLQKEALEVLRKWDRQAEADSKGAVLFAGWYMKARKGLFARKWNPKRPRVTPDGLAKPEEALKTLEEAAREVQKAYGSLDVPWGEVFRLRYGGKDLPANGGSGGLGIFRVLAFEQDEDLKYHAVHGDSFVAIVEFAEQMKAKVLLSYGNATQKHSRHVGDQLELFSKKEFRTPWLSRKEIEKHLEKKESLKNGSFRVESSTY